MNPDQHHRRQQADAAVGRNHTAQLARRPQRVGAVLERVKAQRRADLAVVETKLPQVLDPVHSRAGAEVGTDELLSGEQPPQVIRLPLLHLHGAELHDRLRQRHTRDDVRHDAVDQRAGHGPHATVAGGMDSA